MKRIWVGATVLLVGIAPGVANGATALLVGGDGSYATLKDEDMAKAFGGHFAKHHRIPVTFADDDGPDGLGFAIDKATADVIAGIKLHKGEGPVTFGAVSEGAPVVYEVLRRLDNDPTIALPSEVNAVVYGDATNWWYYGSSLRGFTFQPPPVTPYDLIVVKAQYDGIADFPDVWFNLLAVVNALMGAEQLHVEAAFNAPPLNQLTPFSVVLNEEGGTTTTYLIPTPILPILKPLVDSGWDPAFIALLDDVLRPIIDSAYFRTYTSTPLPMGATAFATAEAFYEQIGVEATPPAPASGTLPPDPGLGAAAPSPQAPQLPQPAAAAGDLTGTATATGNEGSASRVLATEAAVAQEQTGVNNLAPGPEVVTTTEPDTLVGTSDDDEVIKDEELQDGEATNSSDGSDAGDLTTDENEVSDENSTQTGEDASEDDQADDDQDDGADNEADDSGSEGADGDE